MSPLSDFERERICDEELLRHELRRKLQDQDKHEEASQSRPARLFKHPATLLILGFVLTSCAGSWLTYYWKNREISREREYLKLQSAVQKKNEVIDLMVQAVAETNTAAEDVLSGYQWRWEKGELDEKRARWLGASRKWRVDSKILRPKLSIYFDNPEIHNKFESVVAARTRVGNIVTNLLTGGYGSEQDAGAAVRKGIEEINQIVTQLQELGELMVRDLKALDLH